MPTIRGEPTEQLLLQGHAVLRFIFQHDWPTFVESSRQIRMRFEQIDGEPHHVVEVDTC